MKPLQRIWKKRTLLLIDCFLVLFGLIYFLFFVNKGLVLSDEGYYVHYAERIANGEIPYKDFVLQYSPAYFYLLAFLYKIFGVEILVGRFVSLFASLGVVISALVVLRLYKIKSVFIHILISLILIVLGYPLLHVPLVIWFCALFAVLLVFLYIKWLKQKKYSFLLLVSFLLTLVLLTKQNVGFVFILFLNIFIIIGEKKSWEKILTSLAYLNTLWIAITCLLIWLYSFLFGNINGIISMFSVSKQFLETYPFQYPPFTLIFQPTGVFKLLPYYFPIACLVLVIFSLKKKKIDLGKLFFISISLLGFAVTVFPASDLLHVYPFLGLVIVSSIVYFYKKPSFVYLVLTGIIFVFLGVYITFFTQSYRYEGYFLRQTKSLDLPKTKGITVDMADPGMANIPQLNKFIQSHTKKGDYIFVYPFSPMLYFVLDRKNPSGIVQFVLLESPESVYSEERVISEIKKKHVRYIIGAGPYINDKKISKFILQQKKIFTAGPFVVYEMK